MALLEKVERQPPFVPLTAETVSRSRSPALVLSFSQKAQRVPPLGGRSREAVSGPVNHLMGFVH
jgi:hypothetical protein